MDKKLARLRRARRTRALIKRLGQMRFSVHKTPRHIYAQIIAPSSEVLASASSLDKSFKQNQQSGGNKKAAELVGQLIATRAKAVGITQVAFDRSGFKYHGRVKALADAAREQGLVF